MSKRVAALVAGGLWLAGVGLIVAVSFARPKPAAVGVEMLSASVQGESQLLPAQEEMVWSSELEIPTVVVVGNAQGVTEMQGKDDVIIGPGTVTYP